MSPNKAFKQLLITDPFYGIFLLGIQKEMVKGDHEIKTAAVGYKGLSFVLYINEDFWSKLTDTECVAIIKHEVCHLCFNHLFDNFKANNPYNMNIAQDCHINQIIKGLPDGCVTLKSLEETLEKKLAPNKGSWYYYKEIEKFTKEHPEKCMPIYDHAGSHDLWPKDMSEAERKLYENQLKSQIKNTAEQCLKQAGNIPGELQEIIENLKDKPPVFNWKKYFRRVVGNSITSEIQLTRMRPSKRFPDARGIKLKRKPSILVGVDVSGSISKDDFQDFFSEVHHIYKSGVNITIAECDTEIKSIFEYKGQNNIQRNGCGGTILNPLYDYYLYHKRRYSSMVIFTDGQLFDFKFPPMRNVIWIITHNGNKSQKFPGTTIHIPNK